MDSLKTVNLEGENNNLDAKNNNLDKKSDDSDLRDDNNLDYESDPEESKRSLTSRRRLASDDEEESETQKPTAVIQSDEEFDGQGAPEEYKENESDYYSEEEYQEVETEVAVENEGLRSIGDLNEGPRLNEEGIKEGEKEKKENEPFSVPTAGAFYMHDVRDNARGGRSRRMLGGRQLWELQDNKKWGHDKFEEMSTQERHFDEGRRNSRGRYRGRGKNRGGDHKDSGGNKSKVQDTCNQRDKDEAPPKITKGRGFRKYDSAKRNKDEAPPIQYRQRSVRTSENPHAVSRRAPAPSSDLESGPVSSSKQVFASSLNVASPPFYPSRSSNKETTSIQKRDVQTGSANRGPRSASIDDTMYMSERIAMTKSRNGVDSVGMDKLHINDSVSSNGVKVSVGSSIVGAHPRAQGRDVASSGFQPGAPRNQVIRASMPSQFSTMQHNPTESGGRSLDSNKFQSALVAKEKGSVRGGGQGSFMYGGSQVMGVSGNLSSGHGDQNFAGTPTFLPVMHFGGQHPGGMGVPTVGMAIPGYVAQPNGSGKSEMTWLPVLAGAAGALGSAYGSSYISLESAYHSRPSGQSSSSGASSNDSNTNKSTSEWKPAQTPEVASDEVGQRQRYTEMNFGQ